MIPYKSHVQGGTRTWHLKADEEPSLDRLILPHGTKITLSKELSAHEAFVQKGEEQKKANEEAKALRRARLVAKSSHENQPAEPPQDAWAPYFANRHPR